VNSAELPDAHLIEWFSLTDFRSADRLEPPNLDRLTVVTSDGESLPASTIMEEVSRTDRVLRVRPRADQRDRLGPGWQLRLTEAAQTCLRVLPVNLAFRISTSEPSITVVRPASLPQRLFADGQLEFLERGGSRRTIDLETALRTTGVSGRLVVQSGGLLADGGRLPASILVDGAPVIAPECAALQIPAPGTLTDGRAGRLGGPEAPRDPLESSTCTITPATTGDGGTLAWGQTIAALNEREASCRIGEWTVLVDGEVSDGSRLSLRPGGAAVVVQLRSLTEPENEPRDCTGVVMPALTLEWQSTESAIPVELSVNWARRSSPVIAAAIASPAVLLVALLSLLLLRLINDRWMRPPDANGLWGYEARGMLTLDRRGRPRIEWGQGASGFKVDQDSIGPVTGIGREELRLEGTRLLRRMPGWLRPLDEPVLAVADDTAIVAAHPPASRGRGTLPLGFREAVVLAAASPRAPTADDPLPVRMIVLVPRSGDIAVSEAVETLVHQRIDQLAERLLERLRDTTGAGTTPPPDGSGEIGVPPPGPAGRGPAGSGQPTGWGEDDSWGSPPARPTPQFAGQSDTSMAARPVEPSIDEPRRVRRGPAPVSASEPTASEPTAAEPTAAEATDSAEAPEPTDDTEAPRRNTTD
jgi:hypothetical protein